MDLLNQIKEENKTNGYGKIIAMVGSNRQSQAIDLVNSYGKGSCFPAIHKISQFLGAKLDKFLLADIYGALHDGTSFYRAINENNEEPYANWYFGDTKATILYAQMHKIANQYPNETIVLDFYDDRIDILTTLQEFYSNHAYLMPRNVTLNLHQYDGSGKPRGVSQIYGLGLINSHYRETVLELATFSDNAKVLEGAINPFGYGMVLDGNRINTTDFDFTHVELQTQVPREVIEIPEDHQSFSDLLNSLDDKADALCENHYYMAANKAHELHYELNRYYKLFLENELSDEEFKTRSITALDNARPELETHRGFKQILANIGLAIIGLGAIYVAAGLVNLAITGGKYFFFQFETESAKKLNELEQAIHQIAPAIQP